MWVIQLDDGTRLEYANVVRAVAEFNLYKWRGARLYNKEIIEKSDEKNLINKKKCA